MDSFVKLTKMLIVQKQYHFTKSLFENPDYDLQNKLKPIYYALMYFMKDEYPDEYLKMGSELKETVEEIIAEIKGIEGELKK